MENQKKRNLNLGNESLENKEIEVSSESVAMFNLLMECAKTHAEVSPKQERIQSLKQPSWKWRYYNKSIANANAVKNGMKEIIANTHKNTKSDIFLQLDVTAEKAQKESKKLKNSGAKEKLQACELLYSIKAELEKEQKTSVEMKNGADDGVTL